MRATAALLCLPYVACCPLFAQDSEPESATQFQDVIRPVLVKYCSGCHEDNDSEGAVLFVQARRVDDIANSRGVWESVAEQLRNRTMPPADEAQPSEDQRLQVAAWIDKTLQQTACSGEEYAGSVTTRRLNRREYDNTIRDLLDLDHDFAQKFPIDGSGGEGFDNNGETLFLPPLLLERYLEAATEAVEECVITPPQRLSLEPDRFPRRTSGVKQISSDGDAGEQLVIPPGDSVSAFIRVHQDAPFDVTLHFDGTADVGSAVDVAVDGIVAHRFRLSEAVVQEQASASGTDISHMTARLRLSRGFHSVRLKVLGDTDVRLIQLDVMESRSQPSEYDKVRHRSLVGLTHGNRVKNPDEAARNAIRKLATRAFRRPVTEEELVPFLNLYNRSMQRNDPFEHSLIQALRAVLVSPHFLFRVEAPTESPVPVPISQHELASRLSYFLWSSMPDDRLFRLASENKLATTDVIADEVARMLRDEKSDAFFYEFTGQWLGTIEVAASVVPDTGKFKSQFSTELLMDFRDEPVWTFKYIVQNDRSLLDLLDPGYAVVNERLSKHYRLNGEPPPRKSSGNGWSSNPKRSKAGSFERLNLKDGQRGGVLGMGGVHLLTSYPTRTSPVLRGGWVLETLLGVKVPSPPPNVPELKTSKNKKKLTARESLALHRANPACAACHNLMDPVGFALENYDVLGRWRDKDGDEVIDASAQLPTGEEFSGLEGLRKVLLTRRDDFLTHVTKKMLGYALGRSLTERDDCTVQRIADVVRQSDYKASVLIREVALSIPFRQHQVIEE